MEWDDKKEDARFLTAILFKFSGHELGMQNNHRIPLLDVLEGIDIKDRLDRPGEEFDPYPRRNSKQSEITSRDNANDWTVRSYRIFLAQVTDGGSLKPCI